jgi:hypothetical protein
LFGGLKINLINKKEVYDYPPEVLYYDLIDKTW